MYSYRGIAFDFISSIIFALLILALGDVHIKKQIQVKNVTSCIDELCSKYLTDAQKQHICDQLQYCSPNKNPVDHTRLIISVVIACVILFVLCVCMLKVISTKSFVHTSNFMQKSEPTYLSFVLSAFIYELCIVLVISFTNYYLFTTFIANSHQIFICSCDVKFMLYRLGVL